MPHGEPVSLSRRACPLGGPRGGPASAQFPPVPAKVDELLRDPNSFSLSRAASQAQYHGLELGEPRLELLCIIGSNMIIDSNTIIDLPREEPPEDGRADGSESSS